MNGRGYMMISKRIGVYSDWNRQIKFTTPGRRSQEKGRSISTCYRTMRTYFLIQTSALPQVALEENMSRRANSEDCLPTQTGLSWSTNIRREAPSTKDSMKSRTLSRIRFLMSIGRSMNAGGLQCFSCLQTEPESKRSAMLLRSFCEVRLRIASRTTAERDKKKDRPNNAMQRIANKYGSR